MKSQASVNHVSDTAYWMAAYRVMESERSDAIFRDPLAKVLTGEHGKKIAASMSPAGKYAYWTLVTRTHVIDNYILKLLNEGCTTVVNIGAGLDTRPYRLNMPVTTKWIEMDFAEVIDKKNKELAGETPRCELKRIAVDLSDKNERQSIFEKLNEIKGPIIVLTEGVIPYLTEELVSELALDLKKIPSVQYWLAEYYSPQIYKHFQAESFKKLLGKSHFKFYPVDWFSFFLNLGWKKKELAYLYDVGEKIGRKFPAPWWVPILAVVFGKEKVAQKSRVQGYVLFEKI